jgi:hypothetical protein
MTLALMAIGIGVVAAAVTVLGFASPRAQSQQRISALAILSLACIYCFLADRTRLFEKTQKTTDQDSFIWMVGFVVILGALTISRSTTTSITPETPSSTYPKDSQYLSRDQTEEWKGWMQFVVLLYHFLGMSKVLWVYQMIHLTVASYLFMTGFGHALFFLRTNDFSL